MKDFGTSFFPHKIFHFFPYLWWLIAANQKKKNNNKNKKNENKRIEELKKILFRKKPHKITRLYI